MKQEVSDLQSALRELDYIAEPAIATAVYLARTMQKPLLIEGAAGVGKTEIAKVLARLLETELIRLQCYEGLDVNTALYEWNYQKQLLRLRIASRHDDAPRAPDDQPSTRNDELGTPDDDPGTRRDEPGTRGDEPGTRDDQPSTPDDRTGTQDASSRLEDLIFGREYLLERPLLRAITREDKAPVLLIDEIDRADDGFEAFLLELLSDFQVTVPELGTIRATHRPLVVLTSNRTREIGDALRRRCLYLYVDHPTLEKEIAIIRAKVPEADEHLAAQIGRFMAELRQRRLMKPPGIAETLDWARALTALHRDSLDAELVEETLGCFLKDYHDIQELTGPPLEEARRHRDLGVSTGRDKGDQSTDRTLPAHFSDSGRSTDRPPTANLASSSTSPERTLTAHIARFGRQLRGRGVNVSLGDEIDAARALELIDIGDLDEVYLALRTTLRIGPGEAALFNLLFDRMWRRAANAGALDAPVDAPGPQPPPGFEVRTALEGLAKPPESDLAEHDHGDEPGYSPQALLRRKAFDECTDEDLVAMQRLLERLARTLATRRSRRLTPSSKAGVVDLRRSFRRALGTGGELIDLAHRRRALEVPHLVLLCDTSGSMDAHSRFLLTFMLSLKKIARRSEAFAFNTQLTRLTPWIAPGNILRTLERLASGVEDWSGGTRIGECLMDFADRYLDQVVRTDTTVVILSDGLDRGDIEILEAAMVRIQRKARRVIWLNPLMGDARYRPEAKGMKAALDYVDNLVPAHNFESLEALMPLLSC